MFTATLLAAPAKANLDRVTVESLRNAWGGGDALAEPRRGGGV